MLQMRVVECRLTFLVTLAALGPLADFAYIEYLSQPTVLGVPSAEAAEEQQSG